MGIVLAHSGALGEGLRCGGADMSPTGFIPHMRVHLVKERFRKFEGGHAAFLRSSRHVKQPFRSINETGQLGELSGIHRAIGFLGMDAFPGDDKVLRLVPVPAGPPELYQPEAAGDFGLNLEPGTYQLRLKAAGFFSSELRVVVAGEGTVILETLELSRVR